jgi:lysophospholipase L1-like esterase
MLRTFTALAALALAACATAAPLPDVAQTPPPRAPNFDAAIAAFETADLQSPPPKCATLFVGSSSIRFWRTLKEDFPARTVINRGFGGSTIWEIDAYFDRVVAAYHPKEIVFYAGDNDLAATPARTVDDAYADFVGFMRAKEKSLGATPVWFIAVKPSKLRWNLQPQMTALNARIEALAGQRDDLAYIDIVHAMLKPDGTPKDIFVGDNLHMTPEGYALWTPIVAASLNAGQPAKAPGC